MPPNGLVIYCGTIVTEEGKEKKVNIDFEPFKPINTSLYLCDNKVWFMLLHLQIRFIIFMHKVWFLCEFYIFQFHTEALTALLADDNKFGFIVMDGNGALFGTLQGNTREVLHKFTVDLPKKHGMWYLRKKVVFIIDFYFFWNQCKTSIYWTYHKKYLFQAEVVNPRYVLLDYVWKNDIIMFER